MKTIIKRLALRTLILLIITAAAFLLMERLTIFTGWPEVMQGMGAMAKIAWAEMAILWIRVAVSPKIDHQELAGTFKGNNNAAAIVYCAHQLTWLARFIVFVWLAWS